MISSLGKKLEADYKFTHHGAPAQFDQISDEELRAMANSIEYDELENIVYKTR